MLHKKFNENVVKQKKKKNTSTTAGNEIFYQIVEVNRSGAPQTSSLIDCLSPTFTIYLNRLFKAERGIRSKALIDGAELIKYILMWRFRVSGSRVELSSPKALFSFHLTVA